MLTWLAVAFGLAFATAVVPVGSIELFLVGLATNRPDIPFLALGAVVAVGQVLGKVLHYYAARGVLRLPSLTRRRPRPKTRDRWWGRLSARVSAWTSRAAERAREHPRWMAGVFGVSSVVGLPPFGATTVLAGLTRMRVEVFVGAGLAGRFVRYSCLAAAPAVVADLLF
jgi:membrane protein YqaA with SNARE-associated domain